MLELKKKDMCGYLDECVGEAVTYIIPDDVELSRCALKANITCQMPSNLFFHSYPTKYNKLPVLETLNSNYYNYASFSPVFSPWMVKYFEYLKNLNHQLDILSVSFIESIDY